MNRGTFLARSFSALAALWGVGWGVRSWTKPVALQSGRLVGANHGVGHLLRTGKIPAFQKMTHLKCRVVVVGGGVAGLAAARKLQQNGVEEVLVLELENRVGGNAAFGQNQTGVYPWGAHYLPIANLANVELIEFLQQCGTILGFDQHQLPIYNEYHLCQSPQERLFLKGRWQEGLVPQYGLTEPDKAQINQFLAKIQSFRQAKGRDNRWAFEIPLAESSRDETFWQLDKLSMLQWLDEAGFTSPYLRWYVSYCCRDDYGTDLADTSAYAGIHYFAARRGIAANAEANAVLTWPEGNGFLVKNLAQQATVLTGKLVYGVDFEKDKVVVKAYDWQKKEGLILEAQQVIVAVPPFVAKRFLKMPEAANYPAEGFWHVPWVVANLTIDPKKLELGGTLAWDNVFYGAKSLGYINANHQKTERHFSDTVLTYYRPLSEYPPVEARKQAYTKTHDLWAEEILAEMAQVHPTIREALQRIDVQVWGHGMAAPTTGFLTSASRQQASQSMQQRVHFAHTDLSGISIFEEAFYHGNRAAEKVLNLINI